MFMSFWRCYYHLVWTTKNREPLITASVESILFPLIRAKGLEVGGEVLAVNGVADHVHVAATIPPKMAVARWMKIVKGASSYEINSRFPNTPAPFRWQQGYGVLTFGLKNLDMVLAYITHQKDHHANGQLQRYLEHVGDSDESL
jgi:putative transposase